MEARYRFRKDARVWRRLPLLLAMSACSGSVTRSGSDHAGSPRERPVDRFAYVGGTLLPTGVRLDPVGREIPVGNMPLSVLASPDGRYAALLLSGWREEGLQIVDVAAGHVTQTLPQKGAFVGMAYSPDGSTLYTSGGGADFIYAYHWQDGRATLSDSIDVTAPGDHRGSRNVAGIALAPDGATLYAAENLSDSLSVVDLASRRVVQRLPAGRAPYQVIAASDGRVYVSVWGDSIIDVFTSRNANERGKLRLTSRLAAGRHPSAMTLGSSGARLFVASASTDRVTVLNTETGHIIATLRDSVPAPVAEGSTPDGLALSRDGHTLYVVEADNNAVAMFALSDRTAGSTVEASLALSRNATDHFLGRMPTQWYPTAVLVRTSSGSDSLVVVNGKGKGTAANPTMPQPAAPLPRDSHAYTLGQLDGTISVMAALPSDAELAELTQRVDAANDWIANGRLTERATGSNAFSPIQHVIVIIKENRTFDQVLSDMHGADGDTTLQYFPQSVSPNHHAIAARFGIYDRFFTNAEVSSQGHPWSTAAYVTDYTEKITPSTYSGRRAEPDDAGGADTPVAGYLWTLAIDRNLWFRNYGEYGNPAPDSSGGTVHYHSSLPDLDRYTDDLYPPFDVAIEDQKRADAWLAEFTRFEHADSLPALETMHLPSDHTAGARAGMHTPRAMFADNDLALGRIIQALSRSQFWRSTAVFVLEDDAQAGPDHVDSHRSVLLVISPYARAGVIHRFVNTTDVLATIEEILHLPALSKFDEFAHPLREIWQSTPDLRPYTAIVPTQSLDERNPANRPMTIASASLDLSGPDRVDDARFNHILWRTIKGSSPYPGIHRQSLLDLSRSR